MHRCGQLRRMRFRDLSSEIQYMHHYLSSVPEDTENKAHPIPEDGRFHAQDST